MGNGGMPPKLISRGSLARLSAVRNVARHAACVPPDVVAAVVSECARHANFPGLNISGQSVVQWGIAATMLARMHPLVRETAVAAIASMGARITLGGGVVAAAVAHDPNMLADGAGLALGVYAGGALALAGMRTLWPLLASGSDDALIDYSVHPTCRTLLREISTLGAQIRAVLRTLAEHLVREKSLLEFFGYTDVAPDVDAVEELLHHELGDIRMVTSTPGSSGGHVQGAYAPDGRALYMGDAVASAVLVHEFTHALHHAALTRYLARAANAAQIPRIVAAMHTLPDNALDAQERANLVRLESYVISCAANPDMTPDTAVTRAAADLLIIYGTHRTREVLEAVGTRFDIPVGGRMTTVRNLVQRTLGGAVRNIARFAGVFHDNPAIAALYGYSNTPLYQHILTLGLVDSLLTPVPAFATAVARFHHEDERTHDLIPPLMAAIGAAAFVGHRLTMGTISGEWTTLSPGGIYVRTGD